MNQRYNLKKKILIAGGSGFIGKHLICELKKKNWKIISLSLKKKIKGVKSINLDIGDKKILFKKLKNEKINYIVNLAGHINHFERKKTYKSHFTGCKNLVDLAIKKKITKFIQIGSSVEYGFLKSPISEKKKLNLKKLKSIYGVSKLKASNYLINKFKQKGLKYIILRPFLVYGPGQTLNRLIPNTIINCLKNKNFPCSSGKQYRDFLYISDFIGLLVKAINNCGVNNMIFNAGSGQPVQVKNVINKIQKIIKKGKPIYGKISLRKDEPLKLYPDIKKTIKYFNWKPKYSLFNGLVKTINYYKNN